MNAYTAPKKYKIQKLHIGNFIEKRFKKKKRIRMLKFDLQGKKNLSIKHLNYNNCTQ